MSNQKQQNTATQRAAHVIATECEAVRNAQAAYFKARNKMDIACMASRRDETTEEPYTVLADISAKKLKEYERVYDIAYDAALRAYKDAEEKFTNKA